jgi:hypothetical protein
MGFWNTIGKVAKGTMSAMEEMSEKIQKYKAEVSQLSNSELKEKYNNTSGWKKDVITAVIKERRGY